MSRIIDEGYFFVDGQKSPIHCVVRETDTANSSSFRKGNLMSCRRL